MYQGSSSWSIKRLSIILTIIALILWSYSICQAKLVVDDFGLLNSFPITYFIALALLTIASFVLWHSYGNHNKLLFLQLSVLIVSLFLIEILIGGVHTSKGHLTAYYMPSDYIIRHGHLNFHEWWYHEFPISWIFYAVIIQVCGIENLDFLHQINPFIWQFIGFPIAYVFLKNMLSKDRSNYCWAGLWILYLAHWFYGLGVGLSPQGFGFSFIMVILALLSTGLREQRGGIFTHKISNIVTFVALTLSHWLSSVFGLATIAGLWLRRRIELTNVVLLAVIITTWTIYTTTFFRHNLPDFIHHALRVDEVFKYGLVERVVSPNIAHNFLNSVRSWHTVAFLFVGFLGAILGLKSRKDRETHLIVLTMAIGIVAVAFIIAFAYKHEIIDKTFLFLTPFIAYFGVKLLNHKVTTSLLCLLLLIAPVSWILSHYANQIVDYMSPANIQGLRFFNEYGATEGTLTGNYESWGWIGWSDPLRPAYQSEPASFNPGYGFLKNPERYKGILFEQLHFKNDELTYPKEIKVISLHYIAISRRDKAIYYWNWNKLEFISEIEASLNNARNCNLVYVNPDFSLYIVEGALAE